MKNNRKIINLNAGPAMLPAEVLQQASEAILEYNGSGMSILEIPHRGDLFGAILEESKALVRELCNLGDDYEVLWLQGGGRLQFCMVPMNFLGEGKTAGYVDSGHWSAEAMIAAAYYGNVTTIAGSREGDYKKLPTIPADIDSDLAYVHITTNNTIYGTQLQTDLKLNVPLIADMSSDIFSLQRNFKIYDLFYAVVQKNLGAAGATLVVIKKNMLTRITRDIPAMLDYRAHVKNNSLLNTPPVYAVYISLLMLRWIKGKGFVRIEQENRQKAALLYNELDRNPLFETITEKGSGSLMNVVFKCTNPDDEKRFTSFCREHNIINIEGHRSVGAFRASLYNAVSVADVEKLVSVMAAFE